MTRPVAKYETMFSFEGALISLLTPVFSGAIISLLLEALWLLTYIDGSIPSRIVGIDCDVGPPVPIPNTEVKHICADNTLRATAREDR